MFLCTFYILIKTNSKYNCCFIETLILLTIFSFSFLTCAFVTKINDPYENPEW